MDLQAIVRNKLIRVLFQPIYDYGKKKVIGYEALSRGPAGTQYEGAKEMFGAAKSEGVQGIVEMACFKEALSEYRSKLFDSGALLFVNFHPEVLACRLTEILCELDGCRERTVIEVTESSELNRVQACFDLLKVEGVVVALDDIGVGDRSFSSICEARVDFLKVDRNVIHGITASSNEKVKNYKLLIRFLIQLGIQSGAKIIAEGIETKEQVSEVKSTGIELLQGFYFSRPLPAEYWVR